MSTIVANWYNESQKLVNRRVTKLFIGIAVILPILFMLLINKLFLTEWMSLPSENLTLTVLKIFNTLFLPLYSFIATTYLFTGESEHGTLLQVRPIRRFELFFSKAIAISFIIGIQLVTVCLSANLSSLLLKQSIELSSLWTSMAAAFLSWLPLIVISILAILLALIINSSVIAISSMIFLYLLMNFLPYVLPNLLYLFPTSYLDWYKQWFGNVSIRWLVQSFTYLCSSLALFFCSGYYIFNKKEW